jgi:hypothetical protein
MIKISRTVESRISQGDVFRDIELVEDAYVENGELVVVTIHFPTVFVLTQDCDLASDYRIRWSDPPPATQDQQLMSVLVAPVYNAEQVFLGTHLSDLNLKNQTHTGSKKDYIKTNQNQRYHYFDPGQNAPLPASVIDFKHYFSMPVQKLKSLKEKHWVFKISEIYREQICQRFANYLSRIGLPD